MQTQRSAIQIVLSVIVFLSLAGCQDNQEDLASSTEPSKSTSEEAIAPRSILEPFSITKPEAAFFVDHLNKPSDRWYMSARYQRPNPLDATSTPIQFNSSANTIESTGVGPWTSQYQRSPRGDGTPQSVFQLRENEGGILMYSQDSPHPSKLPHCQPNCAGYQKHTVFEYRWTTPVQIFSTTDRGHALEVEIEVQIPRFETWNTDRGPAKGVLAGQFAYVLFLDDGAGHVIQYVVMIFDSYPGNNGNESLMLETIGAGNNGYFVMSSFEKNRSMDYTTVPSDSPYGYTKMPWTGFRKYKIRITPDNITRAAQALNAKGGQLSLDVWKYRLSQVGLNQEVFSENNGDAWIMGSSFRNFKVTEAMK